jgi:GrpB-like predicted nucleotidyltransferase (UPF0157 family)
MTEPLGLEAGVVRLVEYDTRWPEIFETETSAHSRRVRRTGPAPGATIGGTSVPGMCSKPILDMQRDDAGRVDGELHRGPRPSRIRAPW